MTARPRNTARRPPRPAARSALLDESGNSRLVVDLELGPDARAERALVSVEGEDLERPLEFELGERGEGRLYGTIALPAGAERRITVRAFDESGRETHAGSGLLTVGRELTPQHGLTLEPREPDAGAAIPAFVGSYRIAMEPRELGAAFCWGYGRDLQPAAGDGGRRPRLLRDVGGRQLGMERLPAVRQLHPVQVAAAGGAPHLVAAAVGASASGDPRHS